MLCNGDVRVRWNRICGDPVGFTLLKMMTFSR
jgi:hypothetical protein